MNSMCCVYVDAKWEFKDDYCHYQSKVQSTHASNPKKCAYAILPYIRLGDADEEKNTTFIVGIDSSYNTTVKIKRGFTLIKLIRTQHIWSSSMLI